MICIGYPLSAHRRARLRDDLLLWFAAKVIEAQRRSLAQVEFIIGKAQLLGRVRGELNARQEKAVPRMFAAGPDGFTGGLSAGNYRGITGAPPATATRDLADLVALDVLRRTGERKATRYHLCVPLKPVCELPYRRGARPSSRPPSIEETAMRDISETDWKTFKRLRERALERFSQRVLDESQAICSDPSTSAHARYVQLYQLMQQRDRELASAFDDLRRSTAALCFRQMRQLGLVTDEELAELSPQFQARSEW